MLAVGLILFSVVNTTLLTLPVGRPGGPVFTIATGPNPDLAAEVGWPGYVDQVGEVVASIPAAQRADTIVLAQSYQQAAALDVLRPANGVTMPAVYSGHNGFWFWGHPRNRPPMPSSSGISPRPNLRQGTRIARWRARSRRHPALTTT